MLSEIMDLIFPPRFVLAGDEADAEEPEAVRVRIYNSHDAVVTAGTEHFGMMTISAALALAQSKRRQKRQAEVIVRLPHDVSWNPDWGRLAT